MTVNPKREGNCFLLPNRSTLNNFLFCSKADRHRDIIRLRSAETLRTVPSLTRAKFLANLPPPPCHCRTSPIWRNNPANQFSPALVPFLQRSIPPPWCPNPARLYRRVHRNHASKHGYQTYSCRRLRVPPHSKMRDDRRRYQQAKH